MSLVVSRRRRAEINVVPLIDVMVVLVRRLDAPTVKSLTQYL